MKTELLKLLNTNTNMSNFGRSLKVKNPELFSWVSNQFLEDASINEKIYAIVNNINERPTDINGNPRSFINYTKGYGAQVVSENPSIELVKKLAPILTKNISLFKTKYQNLYKFIIENTSDFDDAPISERMYCLVNGITERPNMTFKTYERGYASFSKFDEQKELLKFAKLVGSVSASHGSKIKKFIKRNKERNSDLYLLPETDENIKFITCPVIGIRTLNIKKMYVEGILLMTMEEFKEKFPTQILTCDGHKKILSEALAQESANGMTKHQISVIKATEVRAKLDENGESINSKKGKKTRASLMKVGEDGINGYQKIAAIARPKQRETLSKQGRVSSLEETTNWIYYRNFVNWLTTPHKKIILGHRKTGRAGTNGAYHVDHIYSIIHGFKNNISPWLIAHISNLQSIRWEDNVKKHHNSEISFEQLCAKANYSEEQSNIEFNCFNEIINAQCEKLTSLIIFERYNERVIPEFKKKYKI